MGRILSLLGGLSGVWGYVAAFAAGCAVTGWLAIQAGNLAAAERREAAHSAEVLRLVAVNAATEAAHAAEVANLEANLAALNRVAERERLEREKLSRLVEQLAALEAEDCMGGEGFGPLIDQLWGETQP